MIIYVIVVPRLLTTLFASAKVADSEIPLRICQPRETLQPTPSQLDLTDFEVILGGRNDVHNSEPPESTAEATTGETSHNARVALPGLRGGSRFAWALVATC